MRMDLLQASSAWWVGYRKCQPRTDSDLADVREKLYRPRGFIGYHLGCDGESAVAAFHKEISRNLTELCCEDDERSREAGRNTLIKLAEYGKSS
jgi:hypothetical protein